MEIVQALAVERSGEISSHRGGNIDFRRLHRGPSGEPGNFEWSLIQTTDQYATPRHRHNFDQIHHILEGRHSWGPGQWMPTGSVGYFTEGCFYGPQQGGGALQLGLQFGGASGNGFMDYDQLRAGNEALVQRGEFHDGKYTWTDEAGRQHHADGYEAIWEYVHNRPIRYPEPRYASPIVIYPEAMEWRGSSVEAGVSLRHAGTFGERNTSVRFVGVDPSASHVVEAVGTTILQYVKAGELRTDSGQVVNAGAATCFRSGTTERLTAFEATEIYEIRLPEFS
jgi:hypothetical protein